MSRHLPILPILLPLAGALLLPLLGLRVPRGSWAVAVAAGVLATVASVAGLLKVVAEGTQRYAVGGWPPPWGIEVVLDPLSGFVAATISGVGTLALLASGPALARPARSAGLGSYTLCLVAMTGFMGIVLSGDLFNVFVFLEIASIASYALVASGGGPALAAGFRYLVLGTVGASFYLLGVGFLYALSGTLNMADLTARLPGLTHSPLFVGGVAFVVVGLAIKMGLFPLHGWLPDAYTHAPPAVTALLAAVATKAAAYAVARIVLYVLRPTDLPVGPVLAWTGGAAIVGGGILAARQRDARRLLAYSSVSQLGYIALGLGVGNRTALAGAYLHILNHAAMKGALFVALSGVLLRGRGPAVGQLGLGRSMPVTTACVIVAALAMVGIPPAGAFFSKWYLLRGAAEAGQPGLVAVILLGTLLAAVYMYRLTESAWLEASHVERREVPGPVLVALVLLSALVLAVGLGNAPIVTRVLDAATAGAG